MIPALLQTLLVLVCSGTAGCSAGTGSEQVLRSCVGADATPPEGEVYQIGVTAPEEIALADAGVECEQASDCIEGWELHRARANIGGGTATLAYGASANIGPFRFVHAGLDVQTGVSRCPDAFAAFSGASASPTLQAEN